MILVVAIVVVVVRVFSITFERAVAPSHTVGEATAAHNVRESIGTTKVATSTSNLKEEAVSCRRRRRRK